MTALADIFNVKPACVTKGPNSASNGYQVTSAGHFNKNEVKFYVAAIAGKRVSIDVYVLLHFYICVREGNGTQILYADNLIWNT